MGNIKGKRRRPRPLRLHEKLRQIREAYNLSQAEMVSRLGLTEDLNPSDISAFERELQNKWSREPALPHLLRYARVAGVSVEALIDDELELPHRLAPDPLHGVIQKVITSKGKQKLNMSSTKIKKKKR
jgi:transcriptional regulator with XRE-family HTH domain